MRILILSDVHANAFALEAVLEAAPAHEALLCLGDVVGYGVQPNECCDLLRERGAICLLGNHDAAALGDPIVDKFSALAGASSRWTRAVLSESNRAWLASLAPYGKFEQWSFEAVHAGLENPLETYINGIHSARPTWKAMQGDLLFFGHTHHAVSLSQLDVPGCKLEEIEQMWKDGGRFRVQGDGWKTLVNPGSVGQPRDGNIVARFATYDVEAREVEITCVRYDVEAAQNAISQADLPPELSGMGLGPAR